MKEENGDRRPSLVPTNLDFFFCVTNRDGTLFFTFLCPEFRMTPFAPLIIYKEEEKKSVFGGTDSQSSRNFKQIK